LFKFKERPSCYTLSKACATSKKAAAQYCLFSNVKATVSVKRFICQIVECLLRKPNYVFGIMFVLTVISLILFRSSFSSTLGKKGRGLIGLWDERCSGGLPCLSMTIITENFHYSGKYERQSIELNIYMRRVSVFWGDVSDLVCNQVKARRILLGNVDIQYLT